jgi:serine/threonine protein kinase
MMEIDGWQVVRRVSMSAIAEVFLVRPPQKGPLQVLKRLLPVYAEEAGLVEVFQREAALAPHLAHPNLPRVLSSGSDDGVPYIVLEHIRGCPLGRLVDQLDMPMDSPVALALAQDVVSALSHLYCLKSDSGESLVIAHRDITPGNVLVTLDGRAVLIDFGIVAGAVARLETASNVVKATWRYAAPEQLDREPVSSAFDAYALGALLYLMLSGDRPFSQCNDPEEILQAKKTRALSCSGLSDGLQSLVMDATSVDAARRPEMPDEFRARLEALRPASKQQVVAAILDPVLEAERDERRQAVAKKTPLSAEQRGEDITDPARTEDITEVGELGGSEREEEVMGPPLLAVILLLLLIALILARIF